MAFRPLLSKRTALSISAIGSSVAASALVVPSAQHAESATPLGWESATPETSTTSTTVKTIYRRKPIYDEPTPYQQATPEAAQPTLPASTPSEIRDASPSTISEKRANTTEAIAAHIKLARLFLHDHVAAAEDGLNRGLDRAFEMERTFTRTIANLAPAPETGEKLLPGSIYVLVSSMFGSIVTRNRGLLYRGAGPVAFGVTAGWMLLPYTMRNVSDLVWRWEEKVPAVAQNHLLVRGFVTQGVEQAKIRGEQFGDWLEGVSKAGREKVEGLVQKTR